MQKGMREENHIERDLFLRKLALGKIEGKFTGYGGNVCLISMLLR